MTSRLLPGIGIGVLATVAIVAALDLRAGLTPATKCTGATCSISVKLNDNFLTFWKCNIELSAEVTMPMGIDPIEWEIKTAGYSFVPGGNAVTILNDAADFTYDTSTKTVFRLKRSPTVPSGRVYKYNLNIENDSGKFCRVPTLPRIKNE